MSKPDPKENGKAIVNKLVTFIPGELAEKITLKEALDREDVQQYLGESALRQEEFSRVSGESQQEMSKAKLWHENVTNWFKQETAKLAAKEQELVEREKTLGTKKEGDDDDDADTTLPRKAPAVDTTNLVDKKTFEQTILNVEEQGLNLVTTIEDIADRYRDEFGERLDRAELIALARRSGQALIPAYESFIKERREENTKKKHDEDIAAAEKRGEERARLQLSSGLPYPTGGTEPAFTGTLSGLSKDADKKNFGVDAAVRNFHERKRAAGG